MTCAERCLISAMGCRRRSKISTYTPLQVPRNTSQRTWLELSVSAYDLRKLSVAKDRVMAHEPGRRIPEHKRWKHTGRGKEHSFFQLRHDLVRSPQFNALSGNAVKVLLFLVCQFNGRNNGDLSATESMVLSAGICIGTTTAKALKELEAAGFIVVTRHGHRRRCNLYAVTWLPIDECPGKTLEFHSERVASNKWKTHSDPQKLGFCTPESAA
jgi:hypothetical protein